MKQVLLIMCALAVASAVFAQDNGRILHWKGMVGVITAPNVNNSVGNISSGTFPWSARGGSARVNLSTGAASFEVSGLVINGAPFSGTAGPVTQVVGTLVCSPGAGGQTVHNTAPVRINTQGDAHFAGTIDSIPPSCDNPVFLIRIAAPAGAAGLWIATAAERTNSDY